MKNYRIQIKTLPHINSHSDLFFKYKHQNEKLGISIFKKENLNLWGLDNESRLGFFQKGIFQNLDWNNKESWNSNSDSYKKFQTEIENYVKLVWLSKDFINDNGFKNPIGVHWNPLLEDWIIHPGTSRKRVLYYFLDNPIKVIAFNNSNKEIQFEKTFNSLNDIKDYYNNKDIVIRLVADHGSLIPHVHFDQKIIKKNIEQHFSHIQHFFKTTKIEANFDLTDRFGYDESKILSNTKKVIRIRISNPNDFDMQDRAIILAPSFNQFNRYGVKIECS